jgi:hypothetical protein
MKNHVMFATQNQGPTGNISQASWQLVTAPLSFNGSDHHVRIELQLGALHDNIRRPVDNINMTSACVCLYCTSLLPPSLFFFFFFFPPLCTPYHCYCPAHKHTTHSSTRAHGPFFPCTRSPFYNTVSQLNPQTDKNSSPSQFHFFSSLSYFCSRIHPPTYTIPRFTATNIPNSKDLPPLSFLLALPHVIRESV